MIRLHDIFKYYSNRFVKTYVLQDISMEINPGEFITIMGPSGAGKSTLMHIIGMLDEPSDGEYFFGDQSVFQLKERERTQLFQQNIGFIFQAYHLIDDLTVYENLETPLLYKKVPASERKALVADALDRFQIVAKKDLFPNQLSGGQQQIVGIARAIITDPKVILADEPTGNLNSAQGKEIMDMLKKLNEQGATIVQVTHNEKWAAYGHRTIHLVDGMIHKKSK
ncbi:MAG: ABC transporter ATP-binding protein [Candidatus Zhuqueibacterota bacterium]